MTSYDKSVPGMKITEVGTPDARLLRQWAADPHNTICWGLDRVADELERLEVLSQDSEAYEIGWEAGAEAIKREWIEELEEIAARLKGAA